MLIIVIRSRIEHADIRAVIYPDLKIKIFTFFIKPLSRTIHIELDNQNFIDEFHI